MTATSPYRGKSAFCGPRSLPPALGCPAPGWPRSSAPARCWYGGRAARSGGARPGLAPSCAEGWGRRCRPNERPPGNLGRELLLRDAASASSPRSSRHPVSPLPPHRSPPSGASQPWGRPAAQPLLLIGALLAASGPGGSGAQEPRTARCPRLPHGWGHRGGGAAAPPAPHISHPSGHLRPRPPGRSFLRAI